jgi:hypothetical protein
VQTLAAQGVAVEPGGEVGQRVVGRFIATLTRGPVTLHLVDAADASAVRVSKVLAASGATVMALAISELEALLPAALLAKVFA